MVSFLTFNILWILHVERLPHAPYCSHEASVLGALREHPHSCLLSKDKECDRVVQDREGEGGITRLTKAYSFWFPYLLYYWLLAKWSFRSSAYSNRRKLNINNRLFPSRLLFVNKGYKWNKAGKIISTQCSWFSGTRSTCSFPSTFPGVRDAQCPAHLPVWTPTQVLNVVMSGNPCSIKGLHMAVWPFQRIVSDFIQNIIWATDALTAKTAGLRAFWSTELVSAWGVKSSSSENPTLG